MTRYGYLDMPEDYSDVDDTPTKAVCPVCSRRVVIDREQCDWNKELKRWEHYDMCQELPDGEPDMRPNEWDL